MKIFKNVKNILQANWIQQRAATWRKAPFMWLLGNVLNKVVATVAYIAKEFNAVHIMRNIAF